ncbi:MULTISPECIES: hypothetical protein [unclassified Streptomyces]|uniref:hypothetical protein n=1 Tax=unclassified Streptomyces TaxID=2593676 RepID=UPI0036E92E8B
MDNDVSAGSAGTAALGHLALGLTLLAFGIGHTGVVDGVTAADAVSLAQGTYALLFLALLLLGVGQFADSGSLGWAGGRLATVSGPAARYGATAAPAHWLTALPAEE